MTDNSCALDICISGNFALELVMKLCNYYCSYEFFNSFVTTVGSCELGSISFAHDTLPSVVFTS
jgi:hypothetical protein